MKVISYLFLSAEIALLGTLAAAQSKQQSALFSDPPDGSEASAPEVRGVIKPAEVLETTVTRQGGRDIIVQRLALDPNDPVQPAIAVRTAAIHAVIVPAEISDTVPSFLPMLSATVYPGPRTFLSWTHLSADGTSREFSVWSNIDFNHISGIATFLGTDGNQHSFVMAIGKEKQSSGDLRSPAFTTNEPSFIPVGEIPDEALILVASLHKIYATESEKLAAAHAGREAARLTKEAELLANPPQPQDLIIRYRIAETPLPTPAAGGAQ